MGVAATGAVEMQTKINVSILFTMPTSKLHMQFHAMKGASENIATMC